MLQQQVYNRIRPLDCSNMTMLGCLRMQTLIAILTDPHAAAKLSDHSKAHRAKMEILLEEQNRLLCKDSDDPSDNRNSRFLCLEKPGGGGRLLL